MKKLLHPGPQRVCCGTKARYLQDSQTLARWCYMIHMSWVAVLMTLKWGDKSSTQPCGVAFHSTRLPSEWARFLPSRDTSVAVISDTNSSYRVQVHAMVEHAPGKLSHLVTPHFTSPRSRLLFAARTSSALSPIPKHFPAFDVGEIFSLSMDG